jgi:TonB family protein
MVRALSGKQGWVQDATASSGPATGLLTVHSLGERLRSLAAKLVRPLARQSPPSSAPQNRSSPSMGNYSALDRESFQRLLASAYVVQQSQMDSRSRSAGAASAPPRDEPSAADRMDVCLASFRARPLEVTPALFRTRDPSTPVLVILVIALVALMGWMLGRVTWPRTADTKRPPPLVSATSEAAPAQTEENRHADPSTPPPIPPKARNPEAPSDSLVVYQDGKVIFRLKPSEEAPSHNLKSGETLPTPSQAGGESFAPDLPPDSVGEAKVLQRVEPEYPEAARQQQIQGPVVLEVQVGKNGAVQQLTVISGNSMLVTAASEAVRQWRFKPIVQNGRAVHFQIRIQIDFVLP